MLSNQTRVKAACYATNVAMALVGNLSPILFLTFYTQYGISYSLLGLLVLVNFCSQLVVDLAFSFFSYKFNIQKAVKATPIISAVGLFIYAVWPFLFPDHVYVGLVVGTVIFSAGSGFTEVLISPVIAALPAKDPDREMSKLHSVYAWGVVGVILFATVFLTLFGRDSWQWLALILLIVPITASVLFARARLPELETPSRMSGVVAYMKRPALWLFVIAIFLGGAAELIMAQWASGYLENALGIPKVWGDIFGVAMFAVMLGVGRTLYTKMGKNIGKVLFFGAVGATVCYLTAAISPSPFLGLVACALTGFCVSMMWPGSLIAMAERFPTGGVFMYAMMAAGGDFGASVGPQLVGIIIDGVAANPTAMELADKMNITPDQFGMKCGLLVGAVVSVLAVFVFLMVWRRAQRAQKEN